MLKDIEFADAICYSGFRDGQSPDSGIFPSKSEIKEDLLMLEKHWKYLRLYDCDPHAKTVLEVIEEENLDLRVMLGAYILAEENNSNCPWGGTYQAEELEANRRKNDQRIKDLIGLAKAYPQTIFSLSVGNEAAVEWTDHLVSVDRIVEFVKEVKRHCDQPVTFCENYLPWLTKLQALAKVVDFISIHTYPVWEYKGIEEGIGYTLENYYAVKNLYPEKEVVITEAGWATNSNGRGIDPQNVNEEFQKIYVQQLLEWSRKEEVLTFVFEAFDERWKGSDEELEPEKHWGLFYTDRSPKLLMQS